MLGPNKRRIPSPRALVLIALTLAALVTGAWTYDYARRRIAAVEYIRANDGDVNFYSLRDSYPAWVPVPEWLSAPEWLCEADFVRVERAPFSLSRIAVLHELHAIWVDTEIDDAGIAAAPRFQRLGYAMFSGPEVRITDAGMATLSKCRQLKSLTVESKWITDAGLAPLAGLHLTSLDVSGSQVTDAGLPYLAGMPLGGLSLNGTHVTDSGMHHLVGLPLNYLEVIDTSVGHKGALQLKDLGHLTLFLDARAGTQDELRRTIGMNIHVSDR